MVFRNIILTRPCLAMAGPKRDQALTFLINIYACCNRLCITKRTYFYAFLATRQTKIRFYATVTYFSPSNDKTLKVTAMNKLIWLTLLAVATLNYSCSKEDPFDEKSETGKTSLFDKVTNPETSNTENGSGERFDAASDGSIGYTGSGPSGSTGDWGGGNPNGQFEPGVLTAGEWNDLNNWDFWTNLLNNQEYYEDVNKWGLKEIRRYSFEVEDIKQTRVANAEVTLFYGDVELWKTKTDNNGKATLWSDLELEGLTARVTASGAEKQIEPMDYEIGINKVTLDETIENSKAVDIYFAVDATGSMSDEIDYLKAELNDVVAQIKIKNPQLEMRLGSVFYRDEGDEFVTRPFGFTTNETSLISFISEQEASGGGDFPEAVHDALDVAIRQNTWNRNASSRILFLLLDAPPHYTQEVVTSIELSLINAAEEGIKIVPVTASGIDKVTEYLMRSFAILTNGTYVFITDDSGVGNDHLEPTIGDFDVEMLNDLLVRLVNENVQ